MVIKESIVRVHLKRMNDGKKPEMSTLYLDEQGSEINAVMGTNTDSN